MLRDESVQGRHTSGQHLHILSAGGAFMLVMAEIFLGLASMPRWLMVKPSSFPEGMPKTHLLELSFH
jgi:hypothetical protein